MATAQRLGYRKGLVDPAAGRISREIFVNDEIYREELERVFARSWLFVGHESQVPNPGDFFVSAMGEESVILCRDRAGKVRVFLNSCRHRGMKVCRLTREARPSSPARIMAGAMPPTVSWSGSPTSARPIIQSSTDRSGA